MSLATDVALSAVPGVGFGSKLKLALRALPFLAILGLIVYVLILREGNASLEGERDTARIERDQFKASAEQNAAVIEGFSKQRLDNDAIARAVSAAVTANQRRTEQTRQALKEVQNDPIVREWAIVPIPDLVRRLLNDEPSGGDNVSDAAR